MKKKKPKFRRQEATKRKRLAKTGWRRPRGVQSKMRLRRRGKPAVVSIGYKNPEEIREKHIVIHNLKELESAPKDKKLVLSSSLGDKKRLAILEKAEKLGISFINIRNIKKKIEEIKKKFEERIKKKKTEKKAQESKIKEQKEKDQDEKQLTKSKPATKSPTAKSKKSQEKKKSTKKSETKPKTKAKEKSK